MAALAVSWVGALLTGGGNTDARESPPSLAGRSLACRVWIDPRAPIYTTTHRSSSAWSVSWCVCLPARVRPSVRPSVRARSCGRWPPRRAERVALFRQQIAIIIRRHPRQPTDLERAARPLQVNTDLMHLLSQHVRVCIAWPYRIVHLARVVRTGRNSQ